MQKLLEYQGMRDIVSKSLYSVRPDINTARTPMIGKIPMLTRQKTASNEGDLSPLRQSYSEPRK